MRVEAEIAVDRPRQEVFAYLLAAERLPEYMSDFSSVQQLSEGEPRVGTEYSFRMARGGAEGTFSWTKLQPNAHLAWSGPPVRSGLGTMQPAGWWDLSDAAGGTNVKLVMAPQPGGLLRLLAPFMAAAMRRANLQALERLKERLESVPSSP